MNHGKKSHTRKESKIIKLNKIIYKYTNTIVPMYYKKYNLQYILITLLSFLFEYLRRIKLERSCILSGN